VKAPKKLYVVVDVGCLECGEPTFVIAVCDDELNALGERDAYLKRIEVEQTTFFYGGQHEVGVYEVSPLGLAVEDVEEAQ
jgi:hypothetical protein